MKGQGATALCSYFLRPAGRTDLEVKVLRVPKIFPFKRRPTALTDYRWEGRCRGLYQIPVLVRGRVTTNSQHSVWAPFKGLSLRLALGALRSGLQPSDRWSPPPLDLPEELSDQAAAELVQCLYEFAAHVRGPSRGRPSSPLPIENPGDFRRFAADPAARIMLLRPSAISFPQPGSRRVTAAY